MADDPTLKPNLWALRRLSERRGLWDKVVELVDIEVRGATGAAERAELLVEKGHLLSDRLGDAVAAREAFEAAVREDPSSLTALMALERIAARDHDRAALVRVLRLEADATAEPARKAELLLELARLHAADDAPPDDVYALFHEAWTAAG